MFIVITCSKTSALPIVRQNYQHDWPTYIKQLPNDQAELILTTTLITTILWSENNVIGLFLMFDMQYNQQHNTT